MYTEGKDYVYLGWQVDISIVLLCERHFQLENKLPSDMDCGVVEGVKRKE